MNWDWVNWHDGYERPDSSLARRLAVVRKRIHAALDEQPDGLIRVISMCAGQGRDLVGVLPDHPRRADVVARLVELDPRIAEYARRSVREAGLTGVDVVTGDAALTSAYTGLVPADLVLVCGVFGNISDADIRHTIAVLPGLCRSGGTVIWTRHREAPDLTPTIREWFGDNGFAEVAFEHEDGYLFGVGTHRLTGPALPHDPADRLFDFVGDSAVNPL